MKIICTESHVTWFTVGREYDAGVNPVDGYPLILQDDVVPSIDCHDAWVASAEGNEIVIGDIARFACTSAAH